MDEFFETMVDMLQKIDFQKYPTRDRRVRGDFAIMALDGHLVVVHGYYQSAYDERAAKLAAIIADDPIVSQFDPEQDRRDAIQHEFEEYLEQVILPMIHQYVLELSSQSVTFVMRSGGELKLPEDLLQSRGIKTATGTKAELIRIDIPGIDILVP